jgi:drug/metabolite transporter (DMT)-like permease
LNRGGTSQEAEHVTEHSRPSRLLVIAALASVYLIWGSTYLAILFAIDTIPPFMMAGVRFTIAGWLLYGILRVRGHAAPTRSHWLAAGFVGILLLGVGNGGVTWAEQRVPSGVAALILAGTPAWMVLLDWLRPGGVRPVPKVMAGLTLGLVGIGLLVFARGELRVESIDTLGAFVVMLSSVAWAVGSISSRSLSLPGSAMLVTAMQMIVAGVGLSLAGVVSGEWAAVDLSGVTAPSLLALGYLIVFGSWIGFSAYVWLLKNTTPAVASTYAYVNPAIAVFLGWAVAGETVDAGIFAAMAVIIAGVAMITLGSKSAALADDRPTPPVSPRDRVGRWRGGVKRAISRL